MEKIKWQCLIVVIRHYLMSFILIMRTNNWQESMMKAKLSLRVSSRERLKLNHFKFMVTSPKCMFKTLHLKSFLRSSTLGWVSIHAIQQSCSWIPATKPSVNLWSWECLRGCSVTFCGDMDNPLHCPEWRATSARTASAKQGLPSQSQTKNPLLYTNIFQGKTQLFWIYMCGSIPAAIRRKIVFLKITLIRNYMT